MTKKLAQSALRRFAVKTTPDNISPPERGSEQMGDGFFEPGVQDNQSLVVQWQSNDSGLGVVPEQSLAKPVTFEKILEFLCARKVYALAKSISPQALTAAQEHQVQSFLNDTDVKIAMGLCELEQLQSFISVFDINRQRALLLNFGHYDAAITLQGWRGRAIVYAGRDARQVVPTSLSAAGGRGHHYSTLISPQESNLRVVGFSPISKPQCSPKISPSISSSTESTTTGKKSIARAFPRRPHRVGQLPRRPQVDGDDQALRPCERRAMRCGYRGVGSGG